MTRDKKYTNLNFTKRVDHEAGKHRGDRAGVEPAQCEVCGNVYADRRWSKPGTAAVSQKQAEVRPVTMVVCPACEAEKKGVPSGYVHLDGSFMKAHFIEIEKLLHNEAERASEDNPLARIMGLDKEKDGAVTVRTTTEHLAQRLGHALEKAFSGDVRYDFSHENKLAHVWWKRD
ncbi:MAG: hypothetical protein IPG76_15200 [Acidobacteria bacterium]|nr:hypothetical protein [Acidobacteriota bacterium]MBK9707942.1 hypothetical protein [Acidobacteriota bacterium]